MNHSGLAHWKLLSPFLFLRLRYNERLRYNMAAIIVGVAVAIGYSLLPQKPPLVTDQGLLKDVKDFVTVLFPFFVGALAAVATFQRQGLDDYPAGGQVTFQRRNHPLLKLTRRQFVCFIFGYCAALSVILFIAAVGAKAVQPWASQLVPGALPALRVIVVALFSTAFAHLLIITFWGLYYLTDRLTDRPPASGVGT